MAHQVLDQNITKNLTCKKRYDESGWGLYANSDIAARDPIISLQRPLVISLDISRLKDTCYLCMGYHSELSRHPEAADRAEESKLQICSGCHVVRYCSKGCQTWSWKTIHKHECSLFAQLHPNVLPNNVRAIVQLLLLRKANKLPPGEWNDFMNLESHLQQWELRGGQDWGNIGLMARGTKEYSETDLSEQTLREIYGKLLVNSFTMISPCYDPLGLVLHPLAALVNHSCNYNAFVRFDEDCRDHRLSILALRPIARDEQIVVSYVDATNPRHVRQKELQDRYFFTCECSKCLDELTKTEDIPYPLGSNEHSLVEERAFELLASARKDTSITGPILKLQYGIHVLKKTSSWPLHRQPLAALRQQLVVSLIAAQQLHLAFIHAWIQYRHIDNKLMPEKHHPIRLVHQWLLVTLLKRIDIAQIKDRDLPTQKYIITNRSINLQMIFYYLLHRLYLKVKQEECWASFASMVSSMHDRHLGWALWQYHGVTKAQFSEEVEKLKVCTEEILEKELVWGNTSAAT